MPWMKAVLLGCAVAASGPCIGETASGPDEAKSLAAAKSLLKTNFVRSLAESDLDVGSIAQLLRTVDPESGEYLSPQELALVRQDHSYKSTAFGISFQSRDGKVVVVPAHNSPAARAGLRLGDRPIEIAGQPAEDLKPWRLHRLFPDDPSAMVSIVVDRAGVRLRFELKTASRHIEDGETSATRPAPDVLLIRVPKLAEATLRQTATVLASEWNRSPPRALILDLRGNSGGLLQAAIGQASIFVREGSPIATLRSNSPLASGVHFKALPDYYLRRGELDPLVGLPAAVKTLPLVVLVDKSTASGAELVAAAIQDNGRGAVYGRPTAGVASIHLVSMLPNGGAIRYTSAYWDPPSAVPVHGSSVRIDKTMTSEDPMAAVAAALATLQTDTDR
jgi:carboxyl-terminal processing protease